MFSIGEKLKRARLEQGLDLPAVAALTKISTSFLVAIESDDRKKLPSGFFYKSFVDQYARTLSLDTKEIDAEIDRILAQDAPLPLPGQDDNPIQRVAPIMVRDRRRWPSVAGLMLMVLGCSGVYAWWHDGRLPIDLPQLLQWQKAPEVVQAAKQEEPAPPATAPATEVSLSVRTEPEQAAPPVAPIATAAAATPAKSKLLLDLIAVERTWLSVSSDGKPVFSGVLAPRQTKTIAGEQYAKLKVGNAAGLEVRLNGKSLGQLGARGQVVVVVFTPDNFQIVEPSKEGD